MAVVLFVLAFYAVTITLCWVIDFGGHRQQARERGEELEVMRWRLARYELGERRAACQPRVQP